MLGWAQQQGERLRAQAASLAAEREEVAQLVDWITAAEEALGLRDQEPLPEEAEQLEELSAQHTVRDPVPSFPPNRPPLTLPGPCPAVLSARAVPQVFMEELNRKQPDVEKVTKSCKRKLATELGPPATRRLATRKGPHCPPALRHATPWDPWLCPHCPSWPAAGRRSAGKAAGAPAVPLGALEPQSPLMAQLLHRWQHLWLLALDRQYRLETAQQRLREVEASRLCLGPLGCRQLIHATSGTPRVGQEWRQSPGWVGWSRQHPGALSDSFPAAGGFPLSLRVCGYLCDPEPGILGRLT